MRLVQGWYVRREMIVRPLVRRTLKRSTTVFRGSRRRSTRTVTTRPRTRRWTLRPARVVVALRMRVWRGTLTCALNSRRPPHFRVDVDVGEDVFALHTLGLTRRT